MWSELMMNEEEDEGIGEDCHYLPSSFQSRDQELFPEEGDK